MNRTHPLPYDDTPTGHTYAAAWWTLTGFGALFAVLAVGLFSEAAIHYFFG